MIKLLMSWITMSRIQHEFVDQVSGKDVYSYVDCYGQFWLAERWPYFFRVQTARKQAAKDE